MSAQIIQFPTGKQTAHNNSSVLALAIERELSRVVVIGWDDNGQPFVGATGETVAQCRETLCDAGLEISFLIGGDNDE